MLAKILYKETDNKVVYVNEKQKKQELVVLSKKLNQIKLKFYAARQTISIIS